MCDRKSDIMQDYERMQQDMVNFRRSLAFIFGDYEKKICALEAEKAQLQDDVDNMHADSDVIMHGDNDVTKVDLLEKGANATIERSAYLEEKRKLECKISYLEIQLEREKTTNEILQKKYEQVGKQNSALMKRFSEVQSQVPKRTEYQ